MDEDPDSEAEHEDEDATRRKTMIMPNIHDPQYARCAHTIRDAAPQNLRVLTRQPFWELQTMMICSKLKLGKPALPAAIMKLIYGYCTSTPMIRGSLTQMQVKRMADLISLNLFQKICAFGNSPDFAGGDVWMAGGSAVYCLNDFVDKGTVGDVDIFVCNGNRTAYRKCVEIIDTTIRVNKRITLNKAVTTIHARHNDTDVGVPIQIILFEGPIESVISAFDIDCTQCAIRYDSELEEYTTRVTTPAKLAHTSKTMRIFRDVYYDPLRFRERICKYIRKGFKMPAGVDSLSKLPVISGAECGRSMSAFKGYNKLYCETFAEFNARKHADIYLDIDTAQWKISRVEKMREDDYHLLIDSTKFNRMDWQELIAFEQRPNRMPANVKFIPMFVYVPNIGDLTEKIVIPSFYINAIHASEFSKLD
jgi:hypothetical protein